MININFIVSSTIIFKMLYSTYINKFGVIIVKNMFFTNFFVLSEKIRKSIAALKGFDYNDNANIKKGGNFI